MAAEGRTDEPMPWEEEPIEALGLSRRMCAVLRAAGVERLGHLFRLRRFDLSYIPQIGPAAAKRILDKREIFLQDPEGALQRWKEAVAARSRAQTPLITADTLLMDLKLPARPWSALRMAKVKTVGQLCALNRAQLRELGGFGPFVLQQLEEGLASYGLRLAEDPPRPPAPIAKGEARHYEGSFVGTKLGPFPVELAGEPLETLGLTRRLCSALMRQGLHTLGDLEGRTVAELLCLRGVARTSAREILRAIAVLLRHRQAHQEIAVSTSAVAPVPVPITDLHLPARARRLLAAMGAKTTNEMCALTRRDLLANRGIGRRTVKAIEGALACHGLKLAEVLPRQSAVSFERYARACAELLAASGGIMTLDDLALALSARFPTGRLNPLGFARLVLPMCPGIRSDGDVCTLEGRWDRIGEIRERVGQQLAEAGHPLPVDDLIARGEWHGDDEALARTYLRTGRRFRLVGEWCTTLERMPGGNCVWAAAALYQLGQPATWAQVGRVLGEIAPHLGELDRQAICAMLRRAPGVAEVGRGVFALRGAEQHALV